MKLYKDVDYETALWIKQKTKKLECKQCLGRLFAHDGSIHIYHGYVFVSFKCPSCNYTTAGEMPNSLFTED